MVSIDIQKIIIICLFISISSLQAIGQGYVKSKNQSSSKDIFIKNGQRHRRGIQGVELLGGLTTTNYRNSTVDGKRSFGIVGHAGYVRYVKSNFYYKGNFFYLSDKLNFMTHSSSGVDATAAYTIWRIRNSVFINPMAGVTASYDLYRSESTTKESTFKYGGYLGLESEIYLSNHFSIIVDVSRRYVFRPTSASSQYESSQVAGWWFVSVGLRYHYYKSYLDCL